MNKYCYDEILRVSTELSFFMLESGMSINKLAEALDVDKSIIREDVINLYINEEVRGLLYSDEKKANKIENLRSLIWEKRELLYKNEISDNEKIIIRNEIKRLVTRISGTSERGIKKGLYKEGKKYGIRSGLYDDIMFMVNSGFFNLSAKEDESLLVLSSDEYAHLNEFLKSQNTALSKMGGIFKVKNSLEMIGKEAEAKYSVLDYIKDGKNIKFNYKGKKGNTYRTVKISPKWINYNSESGFIYIVDGYGDRYRLDRIEKLNEIEELEDGEEIDTKGPKKNVMIDFKIIIRKKPGFDNLINKIKNDVVARNMNPNYNVENHFIENETEYVYSDQVPGNEWGDLKSWIFSYGSSMVVVEPLKLRKEIIDSYRKRLEYYS